MDNFEPEEQVLTHLKDYKCSCCLDFMNIPHISTCGHRFCKSCITSWLKQNKSCPMCKCGLRVEDIFPDNFTKRKLAELKIKCSNAKWGCLAKLPPNKLDAHLKECVFESTKNGQLTCPFNSIGCNENIDDKAKLQIHLQQYSNVHFSQLLKAYSELKIEHEELEERMDEKFEENEEKFTNLEKVHLESKTKHKELKEQMDEKLEENEEKITDLDKALESQNDEIGEIRAMIKNFKESVANDFKRLRSTLTNVVHKQEQFKRAMASW